MQESRDGSRCCVRDSPYWIGSQGAQKSPPREWRGQVGSRGEPGAGQRSRLMASICLLVEVPVARSRRHIDYSAECGSHPELVFHEKFSDLSVFNDETGL